MSTVDLTSKIPNNVDLDQDKRLLRALEQWQPDYLKWWMDMGPSGFQTTDVYLRTAISVDAEGWANFDWVKMPDYRWGIFLADPVPDRKIGFGDNEGRPAWPVVPGEHRNTLRRLIVTQGDTEPASVEQQRMLGHRAPSLYDLRNLFQVNVEEGRHLWAMVYLLHSQFGRDGREEAEALLERRSGDADKPRILGAFNAPVDNWLDFFMFTMFTDRDGKYQLLALAESGFDPLSRTTRFMLTEEAHHMFVGESGVERIVQRTAELMQQDMNEDAAAQGGIPLDVIQRYLNLWFALSLDLFGGEISSNAASFFADGLKGRYREDGYEEHRALDRHYRMPVPKDGAVVEEDVPLRNAMNEVLRDAYVEDCQRGVDRWNKHLERAGLSARLRLPSKRFYRHIGLYADLPFDLEGKLLDKAEWERRRGEWLPTEKDRAYVATLQKAVREPGQIANWIARPARGIKGLPFEYEYVRLD
ncbi:MAG: benzoyl-CoA 2,3-epoxidase subunit BoxB [Acidobacteria bacterium]|nr:MAG: benzoyl-CoA 2,3-epoxidase subunit BoxB [Acidobacteriota bacterium]PYQ21946.1 MAG: benzoyl-CoA 2,3-epoxidase subunit BoxB [Acidobacteriota bacterium]